VFDPTYVFIERKSWKSHKVWIVDLIAENNNDITTSDLAKITKLHRDTIYSNCKELIEERYIGKVVKKELIILH
jgi:predicted HTH transcriptional regulator